MIKLSNSAFYNETKTRRALANFVLKTKQFSFGPQCELFEKNFAKYQKRKDAVFVNSGSSANFALIQALINLGRLKRGDVVGFSAVTWSTNVAPLIALGLKPVPIDVELDTLNVSSRTLLNALKNHSKMRALMITNLLGFCDDLEVISKIAKEKNIILIEDNCEALGSSYRGKKLGNFGIASTFSFFIGHHLSTIEGGMIATDDKTLAEMLRMVRAHGWDRNLAPHEQKKIRAQHGVHSSFYARYTFYTVGNNFRPTEVQGFLGNRELPHMNAIAAMREKNFLQLAKKIYERRDLYYPIRYSHMDVVSNFAVPIICRNKKILDMLIKRCEGVVEIRPIVAGDITQQPFFRNYEKKNLRQANASVIHHLGMYFANNEELSSKDLKTLEEIFTYA